MARKKGFGFAIEPEIEAELSAPVFTEIELNKPDAAKRYTATFMPGKPFPRVLSTMPLTRIITIDNGGTVDVSAEEAAALRQSYPETVKIEEICG